MAEGSFNRATTNPRYNRAEYIESIRNRIPLGDLIKFPEAMTRAQLQEIPMATITTEHIGLQTKCAVCFLYFTLNEVNVRKLPCDHMYHENCIFPWLKENPSCPICRSQLVNDADENFEDAIRQHMDMLTLSLWDHFAGHHTDDLELSFSLSDDEPSSTVVEQQPVPHLRDADARPRRAAAVRARTGIRNTFRPRSPQSSPTGNKTTSTTGR